MREVQLASVQHAVSGLSPPRSRMPRHAGNVRVRKFYLSYIHLGSSVCHPVCHPVCRSCGTLSYSLCFSNQTDQGDETEGLKMEGLEMER